MKTKIKSTSDKPVRISKATSKIEKRGLVGVWRGKIKINDDIDNVFNLAL